MKKINTRTMVNVAMFTTISVVLYMFEFIIIPGSPLQADLSDLPVVISGFVLGPGAGVMVAFLKNIIHLMFMSKNGAVAGEIANFFFSISLMLPIALIKPSTKFRRIVLYLITILGASLIMNVLNYYITFPLFGMPQEGAWILLFTVFFPFNIIKGVIVLLIFYILRPHLNRIMSV